MQILICAQEYYPDGSGIAHVVHELVLSLKKRGHKVKVLSPIGPDFSISSPEIINKWAGLGIIFFWNKVRIFLKNKHRDFDVIWFHNPRIVCRIKDFKAISTSHGGYEKYFSLYKSKKVSFFRKLYFFFMRWIERRCDYVNRKSFLYTAISKEVSNELIKHRISKDNIRIISNGVDTNKFIPESKKGTLKLIYVGRLAHMKNIPNMVRAVAALSKIRKLKLLVVGDGEQLIESKKLSEDICPGICEFRGRIPFKEIPHVYGEGHYYVISSLYEGQPLTVLEALSSGLPCIVNDIPPLREIVEWCGEGLIVDFNKPEEAAKKIDEYISSTDIITSSQNVRDFAVNNIDWERIIDFYENAFEEVNGE